MSMEHEYECEHEFENYAVKQWFHNVSGAPTSHGSRPAHKKHRDIGIEARIAKERQAHLSNEGERAMSCRQWWTALPPSGGSCPEAASRASIASMEASFCGVRGGGGGGALVAYLTVPVRN